MYKIIKNVCLKEGIFLLEVVAPLIVKKYLPGQFLIVMADDSSERIPLTIYDVDDYLGTVSMIYRVVGASTLELSRKRDFLSAIVGPLGCPSEIVLNIDDWKEKRILYVAGGVGIAPVMAQIKYLVSRGVECDLIYGTRNKSLIILEDEIKNKLKEYKIVTDDGSYGIKGTVVDAIQNLDDYDACVAIGPVIMMKYVALKTKEANLKTIVSMNPIMVDGTGMCGACRVVLDGEVKFACVDGPEFDGAKIDFDVALKRMEIYKTLEGKKYLEALEGESHHGGCGECGHE